MMTPTNMFSLLALAISLMLIRFDTTSAQHVCSNEDRTTIDYEYAVTRIETDGYGADDASSHSDYQNLFRSHTAKIERQEGRTGKSQISVQWFDLRGGDHDRNIVLEPYFYNVHPYFSAYNQEVTMATDYEVLDIYNGKHGNEFDLYQFSLPPGGYDVSGHPLRRIYIRSGLVPTAIADDQEHSGWRIIIAMILKNEEETGDWRNDKGELVQRNPRDEFFVTIHIGDNSPECKPSSAS